MESSWTELARRLVRIWLMLTTGVILLPPLPAEAGCRIRQLTNALESASANALISGDGTHVVFTSTRHDREEFILSLARMEISTGLVTPIATILEPDTLHFAANEDASRIVFEEYREHETPFRAHLVLYAAGTTRDLPLPLGSSITNQALDGTGSVLAFRADGDPTGGNPDGNDEIFVYDLTSGAIRQLTTTTTPTAASSRNEDPVISADGTHVAYVRSTPGAAGTPGSSQIRLVDVRALQDVETCAGSEADEIAINVDGTRVAFRNDQGVGSHVVLCDTTSGSQTVLAEFETRNGDGLAISGAGDRVAMDSDADPVGQNPDGAFEVFLFDARAGLAQVTAVASGEPSISADGLRVTYSSSRQCAESEKCELDRDFEVFLADCDAPGTCGDADGSGTITVTDGVNVLRAAADLQSPCSPATCDVDASGTVSVTDGVNVLRKAADLPVTFSCAAAAQR